MPASRDGVRARREAVDAVVVARFVVVISSGYFSDKQCCGGSRARPASIFVASSRGVIRGKQERERKRDRGTEGEEKEKRAGPRLAVLSVCVAWRRNTRRAAIDRVSSSEIKVHGRRYDERYGGYREDTEIRRAR